MVNITAELTGNLGTAPNTASAICVWDLRTFDDGPFGTAPNGWYKQQYPFIDYAILMTFTGGAGYNEWYRLDENGRAVTDFSVPLRVLKNVLRQGLRPIVVIGNVPYDMSDKTLVEADSYGWGNRYAPVDYQVYYDYILAFADMIRANFEPEEYSRWQFRVGTEPDNAHWWVPGLAEYCKLYDYTVAALCRALGEENITVFSGNLESYTAWEELYQHCESGVNSCTGERGVKNDCLSVSDYQLGQGCLNYLELEEKLAFVRRRAQSYPGLFARGVNVGEGQFLSDGLPQPHRLQMAQEGTEYAASWTAAAFDACCRQNVAYYANWAWCCDFMRLDEPMLKIPAYHVASMIKAMSGGARLPIHVDSGAKEGNTVGAVACRQAEENAVYIMVYNHSLSRENRGEQVTVALRGETPLEVRRAELSLVDREHSNFFTRWLADSRQVKRREQHADFDVLGSLLDTEVGMLLEGDALRFWQEKKKEYARMDGLFTTSVTGTIQDGATVFSLAMDGHSVALLKLFLDEEK